MLGRAAVESERRRNADIRTVRKNVRKSDIAELSFGMSEKQLENLTSLQ
jgi:hypothetical protein